jgi:hypothetical protein
VALERGGGQRGDRRSICRWPRAFHAAIEVAVSSGDVGRPLAQRRQPHRDDAQAVVHEVGAEPPGLDLGAQRAVGRRHDPHVDRDRLARADRQDRPALEHAQELGLQLERQLGDLVEEQRAAVGELNSGPGDVLDGAGERALGVAEQLALEQVGRQRRAVDRAERPGGRGEQPCSARATSSLPEPVSPRTSTVSSLAATRAMMRNSSFIRPSRVHMPWNCTGSPSSPPPA